MNVPVISKFFTGIVLFVVGPLLFVFGRVYLSGASLWMAETAGTIEEVSLKN